MIAVRSVFSVLIICLLLSPLAAESLARPTVFPGSMASSQPLSVQMSSSDADASLRYTLDGSTPDESSALVPAGGQLTISSDSYLRVRK